MKTTTKVLTLLAFTMAFSFGMPALAAEAAINWKLVAEVAAGICSLIAAILQNRPPVRQKISKTANPMRHFEKFKVSYFCVSDFVDVYGMFLIGQSAVIYDGEYVVGGGVISAVI